MDKTFLATYKDENGYSFDWLENEDEVNEYIEINGEKFDELEIIEVSVKRVLFEKE